MNPESSESINPLLDIDSWLDFCQSRGGGMEDHLDTELMSIINNNNHHRGHMNPSTHSSMTMNIKHQHTSYDFPSFINSAEATSVTTMALPRSFINIPTNCSSAMSSNITSGATTAGLTGRPNATGNGAVKVKKKRVRASRRVPTTVLRTDTSNFKAMVQHFTGIPVDTSASSSTTTTTTTNPSSSEPPFTKPLPHPAVCKIPPSIQNKASTSSSVAAGTSASNDGEHNSLSLPSSFSSQSLHDISSPLLSPNVFTPDAANSDIPEEHTMSMTMSAMDAAFFEKLWS